MTKIKTKIKSATLLLFLVMPFFALAQTNASTTDAAVAFGQEIGQIVDGNFNTDSTAITILQELFGSWVKEDGGSQTILMLIISGVAALSAFAGVMMLSYILVTGAATSAMSGEPMVGDKKIATWYMARVAIAYMLILPVNGGVSPFHTVFGQTLIPAASAVGDAGAEVVRQHMLGGGSFSSLKVDGGLESQEKMLAALTCMYDLKKKIGGYFGGGEKSPYLTYNYNSQEAQTRTSAELRFMAQDTDPINGLEGALTRSHGHIISSINFGGGDCGSWSFPFSSLGAFQLNADDETDLRKRLRNTMEKAASEAAFQYIASYISMISQYAYALSNQESIRGVPAPGSPLSLLEEKVDSESRRDINAYLLSYGKAASGFHDGLLSAINDAISKNDNVTKLANKLIKERDWVTIGYSFHDLRMRENVAIDVYLKSISDLNPKDYNHLCTPIKRFFNSCDDDYISQSRKANAVTAGAIQMQVAASGISKAADTHSSLFNCGQTSCEAKQDTVGITNSLGQKLTAILTRGSNNGLVTDNGNINEGGRGSVTIEGIASAMGDALLTTQYFLAGLSMSMVTLAGLYELTPFLKPLVPVFMEIGDRLSGMVQILLAQTFFLKYWIPMMPIFTWMIMVAGFFILAIEVMVAAPIALLLMLMPEGEGISGTRLERFIGLIVGLLLRPILLVCGFVAYLVFNSIATQYILLPLWDVISGLGSSLFGLISIVMLFISALWQLQNLLLSLISSLPGYVAELVTSFRRDYGETSAIGRIGSAGEGFRERTGNSIVSGMSSAAQRRHDEKQAAHTASIVSASRNTGNNDNEQ